MSQDPMDRQLVEAVLAGPPRRRRAVAAEVKAINAASKAASAVAVIEADAEPDDRDLGSESGVPERVVAEEDLAGSDCWRHVRVPSHGALTGLPQMVGTRLGEYGR